MEGFAWRPPGSLTGWTDLVAPLIQLFSSLDARSALEGGKMALFQKQKS